MFGRVQNLSFGKGITGGVLKSFINKKVQSSINSLRERQNFRLVQIESMPRQQNEENLAYMHFLLFQQHF